MSERPDVLIIGGGIIGMACAQELSRRGAAVTLVDKGEIGHGCSYGNAGWIMPCVALPLPAPGMLLRSIGWLFDPDSPLYIQPRPSLALLRWLARFCLSMNHRHLHHSAKALIELAQFSLEAYRKLDATMPGAFGFEQKGLLAVARTAAGFQAAVDEMKLVAEYGIEGRALNPDEIVEFEPAVKVANLVGGVFFPDQAHAEPLPTVQALAAAAAGAGATILSNTEVFGFVRRGRRIACVHTTRGPATASTFVLAGGVWSGAIGRSLGLRIPLMGGKGYGVTVERFSPVPQRPLMLVEAKVAVTPRKDSVRLAGTLELVGLDDSITARRVEAIMRAARSVVNLPENPKVIEVWRGLRPCTPDGMPIISRAVGFENLVLATGHQMLGLLTAPGTARLAADLVLDSAPSFDPKPFRAERF